MIYIAQELERIASELKIEYHRALSMEDFNIKAHYTEIKFAQIVYVGIGNTAAYYEGAEPLLAVETEIYIINRLLTKDALATDIDSMVENLSQIAADIAYRFVSPRETLAYKLEAVQLLDDLMVGFKMTVPFIIEGKPCSI